ncbi:glycosyltransferase family 117 protein [Chitinophaga vietnamensis]|uniref:glycosyltransferase family 117 protein n=1 Tax=Chitinophaga vietnamensis TaxID=2593957 RepID=UPI00137586C5|nr:DUF2723 domain-containing protein [Chitinophaga vietnamensis]
MNNIAGWIICLIACSVYISTREATASFWDCGEFIPCAYKLQISHPPGAPLFIMLGRLFIVFFGGSWDAVGPNAHAAQQVNLLSSLSSGFTILFLFWTITHMGRRLLQQKDGSLTSTQAIAVIAAGATGALAFTFSDSFWFSAVEGIVFGVSPLFISMVFWAILKWEEQADDRYADRWILLIAYLIGLSIGVHLLSLLSIPAIVMTYYFRRYKYSRKGALLAFLVACALTGVVQILVIQDIVKIIGWFDLRFVNDFGLPFNSGAIFAILLLAVLIFFGIRYAQRKRKYFLQLALWCFTFILIGYSSYFMILIRANANPAINMQQVNNPIELVAYLDRSQYGSWPILSGPDFTAKPTGTKDKGNIYYKNTQTGKYDVVGKKFEYDYNPDDIHLFTRAWNSDNTTGNVDFYQSWLGLAPGEKPSFGDHMRFLFTYQFNWMYWRYFMWNFAGRQNDLQGLGNARDGNWISGIPFIDNVRLGDQSLLPDTLKNNKAHNTLFMLPLLLGILGMVYQWKRDRHNMIVVFLLYFFTGIAIILYLNQYGPQPRERDYSYVGSFYAFAIWIGLGVLYVYDLIQKKLPGKTAALSAGVVCLLAVPTLMAAQEWNDHDRSMKSLARDAASDYLNSCAKDAILFTGGDNDTYPLWYAQEVENIRPDVRVSVTSLIGSDWDINQLQRKINQSAPVPFSWTPDKYLGDNRNYLPFYNPGNIPQDRYFDLNEIMAFMGDDKNKLQTATGDAINYFPTHQFFLPVNKSTVLANGTVLAKDSSRILSQVNFTVPGNGLAKNDLAELNIIAANNWQRPIYFSQPFGLGLNNYMRQEGLTYRLVPIARDSSADFNVNTGLMYENLMTKFRFGGAQYPGTYFDENGRRILLNIRRSFATLGVTLAAEGRKDSALKVLDHGYQMLPSATLPYGMVSNDGGGHNITSMQYAYAYFIAGNTEKGNAIANDVLRDCNQQLNYYNNLPSGMQDAFAQDKQTIGAIIGRIQQMKASFADSSKMKLK